MKKIISFILALILVLHFSFADSDIPSSWARATIEKVFSQGLLNNRMRGNYQGQISRRDFAYLGVVIYESLTGKATIVGDASFPDTNDIYVLKAKNAGIVKGYTDGEYKPDNPISRQELSVLFFNVLEVAKVDLTINTIAKFDDDDKIQVWAKEAVYTAKSLGIVNGVGKNRFNPEGTATREQAIIMFKRAIDRYKHPVKKRKVSPSLVIGSPAPKFTVTTLSQREVSFSSLRGKPIILHFFTTWCPPCVEQVPTMQKLHEVYGDSVHIIGINLSAEDSKNDLQALTDKYSVTYSIGRDKGEMQARYQIKSIPTTVFIDKNGKIANYISGSMTETDLKKGLDNISK